VKEHFNLRSLIFYATAIGLVVALFSGTTAYGEKNLQAPRSIHGRYPLAMQAPNECLQAKPLYLLLQQSGIFLTGSLLAVDAPEQAVRIARERPSLSGRWQNNQLSLTGELGRNWACNATVKIDGQFTEKTLNGTLTLSTLSTPIPFSGNREEMQTEKTQH